LRSANPTLESLRFGTGPDDVFQVGSGQVSTSVSATFERLTRRVELPATAHPKDLL